MAELEVIKTQLESELQKQLEQQEEKMTREKEEMAKELSGINNEIKELEQRTKMTMAAPKSTSDVHNEQIKILKETLVEREKAVKQLRESTQKENTRIMAEFEKAKDRADKYCQDKIKEAYQEVFLMEKERSS